MEYKRSERVADLLRKEVADILLRKVKDPAVQGLTITAVEVSQDLQHARVFYCLPGTASEQQKGDVSRGLGRARGFIRQELGKRLHMRYVPQVDFRYDASFDYGDKIERLLRGLHKDEQITE